MHDKREVKMHIKTFIIVIAVVFLGAIFLSCSGGNMSEEKVTLPSINDISLQKWQKLAQKKIYFGHQSVGFNIMDGIKDVMKEHPEIKLNIIETNDYADLNTGIFAHSAIGENMDPESKLRDFSSLIENGMGNKADIAFFKYCFIDILPRTDIQKVFHEYKETMSKLEKNYPATTFIHVTVPLTSNLVGTKAWIRKTKDFVKKIIGRPVYRNFDNDRRNQINRIIRQQYDGKEPVFDLAKIESTFPNGTRSSYTKGGITFYSMVQDYTYDGGHLNEAGRIKIAEQLLIFLANMS